MRAKEGALSHFDEALNALLLLAHVALRQGDAVGCVSFGAEARVIAPRKGHRAQNDLLENLFDLGPGLTAPDYRAAAALTWRTTSKRSLVLILTNLRDEDGGEIEAACEVLRRRHLVLVASLRESAVAEILARRPRGFEDALQIASAHHYLNARRRTLDGLRLLGTEVLDVEPPALPVALVNRYLDIKRGGVL
jgi:uncharacterized protein (DUF58 family)